MLRRRGRSLRIASSSARVSRDGAIARVLRRRSAKRSPAASAAARSPAAARRSINRRLGSSASGSSATCSRVRSNRFGGGRRRRELLERPGEPVRVDLARLVGPVVFEAVQDRRRAGVERRGGVVARERGVERARVDPEPVVEDDRLAGGDHVAGGRAERPAQLGERGPQARAGGLVEHVGPEARGDLRAAVGSRVQRQVGEHATGAARCGWLDVRTLEPQPAGEPQLQHGSTLAGAAGARKPRAHRSRAPSAA